MPYIEIEDFRSGQDSRKSKTSANTGTLRRLTNAHIDRGGAVEKRKAFVSSHTLPSDTFGMATVSGGLYTFGSKAQGSLAAAIPAGFTYQRLQHSDNTKLMTAVLQTDIFGALPYVVATFDDASVQHFYNGTRVSDWYDGRARGFFTLSGIAAYAGVSATTTVTITGGSHSVGVNKVSSITIGGVEILNVAVDWVTSNDATATAVAAQITSYHSTPEYTATASGPTVTITRTTTGVGNGLAVVVGVGGDVTTSGAANTAGAIEPNGIETITVNGVEVLGARVVWATTNAATAAAVAAQISSYTSSPEYTATSIDGTVVILAAAADAATPNGFEIAVDALGAVTISDVVAMAGGTASAGTYTPGRSIHTLGTKMYAVSGKELHYSKVDDPTKYNSDQTGAGFIDMSKQAAEPDDLIGMGKYLSSAAIFAPQAIQIWTLKADEEQNAQLQVIQGAGTRSPRTIKSYKTGDLTFLDADGIRSLRSAGDVASTATVFEVGTAIDPQVADHLAGLSDAVIERALSEVEPQDKRLWVSIDDRMFVFSYFSGAKISAWSEYLPGFSISDFAIVGKKIYARSGTAVYLYGGANGTTYDTCEVIGELPFLSAKTPATFKKWTGFDADLDGTWVLSVASDPRQPDTYEEIATVTGPTFNELSASFTSEATHIALKFVCNTDGYARISSLVLHYETEDPS